MWHSFKFYLYLFTIRNKEVKQGGRDTYWSSFILWCKLQIGRVGAYLTMVFASFVCMYDEKIKKFEEIRGGNSRWRSFIS